MSVYATIFDIGEGHAPRCARIEKVRHKFYKQDDSKPCTCGACPILFQGSHVLPSNRDKRGGCIMLAAIPSHITRDGRDDAPAGKWYPWLRLSVFDLGDDSVVLTRKQAKQLRDALDNWLTASKPKSGLLRRNAS